MLHLRQLLSIQVQCDQMTAKNVYLLVRHVPFMAKGAGFLLQCTKCSRQAPLYNGELMS